jgi:hypothetical protein
MEINPKHHVAAATVFNLGYMQSFTQPYYFQHCEKWMCMKSKEKIPV